jgi:hypothetical protein
MRIYTKESLIAALREIAAMGWIRNARPGNAGGVGNTLEDLLGITENNLPVPNAAEWELKCQRANTGSLTTLFHMEPSPRAMRFVPNVLLPKYGWAHAQAGATYPPGEMSFRQTINGLSRSDRGFGAIVDRSSQRVLVSFDSRAVDLRHAVWLDSVHARVGLAELSPQPFWGFLDLFHKAGTKLLNCFYVVAERQSSGGAEYFRYSSIQMLERLSLERFLSAIEQGHLLVDFDARTGHNHGTKFRLRQNRLPDLYEIVTTIA